MKNLLKMNKKLFYTLGVLVCLLGVTENAWGGGSQTPLTLYYARLSVEAQLREGGTTARGLVYASTAANVPEDADYKPSMVAGPHNGGDKVASVDLYAWALPDRGFEFSSWAMTGANAPDSNGKITVDASSNQGDETNPKDVTAIANFTTVAPKQITYKGSEVGSYVVSYQYRVIDNKEFAAKHDIYNLTSGTSEEEVESYKTDKITLTASPEAGFLGWYKDEETEPFSTSATYTVVWNDVFATSATSYSVKPKWSEVSGDVARVNSTDYATLKEAIDAANLLSNPVVTILQNIYNQPEQLEITASMTIDLNGKMIASTVNRMLQINGENIEVTLQDGGSNGTISVTGALNERVSAVFVEKGKFNLASGIVETKNTLPFLASEHERTTAAAIYVNNGADFAMTGGTINTTAAYQAYGIYVSNGATATIEGGVVNANTSQKSSAYAVYTMGEATISEGTLNAVSADDACGVYVDGSYDGFADVLIEGGAFNVTASNADAAGACVADGHLRITAGTFTVKALESASGVVAGAKTITTQSNNGQLLVEGGTFDVNTANATTTNQYGVYVSRVLSKASDAGYVSMLISDGIFNIGYAADAKKSIKSFGIYVNNANVEGGEVGNIPSVITGGKFKIAGTGTSAVNMAASALELKGGCYQINTGLNQVLASGYVVSSIASGTADYTAGYRYEVKEGENTTPVCEVGGMSFLKLEDAISYVNNYPDQNLTILMKADYTLSAGYYTIPKKTILLVPMSGQTSPYKRNINRQNENTVPKRANCTLTLSEGVHLDVFGAIETGGSQNNYSTGADGTGRPRGETYGLIITKAGSDITLEDGAFIYAWGFIIGSGSIDVRRGATVYEQFQIYDFKGGRGTYALDENDQKVFPVNQYFIQNIEILTTYRPGAVMYAATAAVETAAIVKMIGTEQTGDSEPALFLLDDNADSKDTWIRKRYDIVHDRQVYEINNSAQISGIKLTLGTALGDVTFDSRDYVLPITNNMSIHLLTGDLHLTQSTMLLAGAEIEVDKQATVTIDSNQALYLFDFDQWGKFTYSSVYAQRIKYTPSLNGAPTAAHRDISSAAAIGSAKLNIHGTFDVKGAVYTTSSGANIYSTNDDAGTITFSTTAPTTPSSISMFDKEGSATGTKAAPVYYLTFPAVPALLRNEDPYDGSYYTSTAGTEANKSFCYMDKKWRKLTVDENDACFVHDQYNTYYAKAGEYVAINATKNPSTNKISGNEDHTYSDAAGAGRLFILTEGCQWWEVENVDNLYHCTHPQNDTYYYWDNDEGWLEKLFAISWRNWDGSYLYNGEDIIYPYYLSYGAMPKFLSKNPQREADIDYTYKFTGWSPEITKVTEDKTYTATFEKEERKYVIIFKNGGIEVERQFLKHNEMPTPPTLTNGGMILQWDPAISAVTGDATYTATWLETEPDEYEITFVDYDGTTILKSGYVNKNEMPTAPAIVDNKPMKENGTLGGKPATSEYTYVFDHWSPTLAKVTQAMVYTAVYSEVERTYEVKFFQEDGKTQIGETQNLPLGATPIIPSYSGRENTAQYTYSLEWVDKSSMGEDEDEWIKSVQTVVGNVNYVAHYDSTLNKYTVSLKCNPSGAATLTGAGLYDYDGDEEDENRIVITVTPNEDYIDPSWSDGAELGELVDGKYTRILETLTCNVDLAINFTYDDPSAIIITWKSENGEVTLKTVGQKNGTATTYTGAIPTKEATAQYTYTFDGWTTAPNGEGTYYKNGLTPSATADVSYYAHFSSTLNKYNVTLTSAPVGVATLSGAGSYNYNSTVAIAIANCNANYNLDKWTDTNGNTVNPLPTKVTGDINLTANFSPKTYTVTWMSEDGESILKTDADQAYGAATAYTGATPTKPAGSYVYAFTGWTTAPNGGGLYYINGATPTVPGDVTYYAFFSAIQNDLDIPMNSTVSLTSNVDYTSFTITSNGNSQSGELIEVNYLTITGEGGDAAYFDLAINAQNHRWYAVAVPWKVDAETGISINGRTLRFGIDFDILYYDGDLRASAGANKSAWKYMEDEYSEGNRIMQPGTLYMIGLMMDAPIIRFAKKAGEPLSTTSTSVVAYSSGTGSDVDAGWNGIANPALFHAYLNAGVELGQSYNALTKGYEPINLTTNKLVVGQPVFVQVPSDKAITVAPGGAFAAPRKAPLKETKYEVQIAPVGEDYSDRLFICADNDKETDTYVIGLDLAKFGVTSQVAQIWVDRYDAKLCLNTVALVNETANYPLGISIPESGEYEIKANVQKSDEMALYITYDGGVIWDLSDGSYTLDLNSGTITNYGLRVSAHKTPTIATNLDEAVIDAQGKTCKVLIENKVFIIRGNNVYSVDGQLVK